MAKEQKTSIDLRTAELSEDKVKEIKGYNGQLQQLMGQIGELHIRKNQLHSDLERIDEAFTQAETNFKEVNAELRKELNKLERDYPRGQLDLEKGTVTYNPAIKEQMEQQAQQGGRGGNNGVDGGEVVDSPFVKV
jgi:prefoldin subunit 5|tara:strand:+ start:219 stop:623 length:405 start_codon:yes stop_codon:yes gene_type:complete